MIGKVSALIVMLAACAVASGTPNAYAEPGPPREYQIKAAFLYNFVKFVEWPTKTFADTNTPIIIGVLGKDPFGGALEPIEGKNVKGRKVVIRRFKGVRDLKFSHVLFVSSSEKERLAQIMKTIKDWSVLTVGDMERFTEVGGIINLVIERNKVRFEVNLSNAERAGLKLSSRLLKLARVVRK